MTEVLRTTIENRQGRIAMEATITSLATQRTREVIRLEGQSSRGLLPLANSLARALASDATFYSTRSERALKEFSSAVVTPNLQNRAQLLNDAIAADPTFGAAYIALAETMVQTGQDALPVLNNAAGHRDAFTPIDRAEFDALRTRFSHAPLPDQQRANEAILQLAPNDVDAMAGLASARFLIGDTNGGERLLRRALELSPTSIGLRQQLAVGLLEMKHFRDAEAMFRASGSNPAVLPTLAICILLEGDTNRADAVFNQYMSLRPTNDPLTPLLRGSWFAISGRISKAIDLLESTSFPNPGLRAVAFSQIAMWQLLAGDRTDAKKAAASASRLDSRPASLAGIADLLARGDERADAWRAQVNALDVNEQTKQSVLGYGLFLNGHYREAIPVWQEIFNQSGGADLRSRTMLAASLERAGNAADAQKILVEPFVPEISDWYAAISFGEMRRLLRLS